MTRRDGRGMFSFRVNERCGETRLAWCYVRGRLSGCGTIGRARMVQAVQRGVVTRLPHAARAAPCDAVDDEGSATHRVENEKGGEGTWPRFWGRVLGVDVRGAGSVQGYGGLGFGVKGSGLKVERSGGGGDGYRPRPQDRATWSWQRRRSSRRAESASARGWQRAPGSGVRFQG